jgi:hypothetical protein
VKLTESPSTAGKMKSIIERRPATVSVTPWRFDSGVWTKPARLMNDSSAKPVVSGAASLRVTTLMMPPVERPSSAPNPPGRNSMLAMNSDGSTLCRPKKW